MQSSSQALILVVAACTSISFSAESSQDELVTIPLQRQVVEIHKQGRFIGNKTSYFGMIQAGTPGKYFSVVFDTGSGHVVIPSVDCPSPACRKHTLYDRKLSTSASDIVEQTGLHGSVRSGITATVTFGTGTITADFVNDQLCLSETDSSCTKLGLLSAVEMSDDPFNLFDFDGVFGLGLPPLSLSEEFHFLEQFSQGRPLAKSQFALFMASDDSNQNSHISFGGYSAEKALTPMLWAPLARSEQGYWQFHVKSIRIGDTTVPLCSSDGCYAIVDSGSSMVGIPKPQVTTFHKQLARLVPQDVLDATEDHGSINCRAVPSPPLVFDLGDFELELTHEDLSKPQVWNVTKTYREDGKNVTDSALWCRHMLLPVSLAEPVGGKTFVLGEPFLRRYYTVFDAAAKRLGFSLANQEGTIIQSV